jgi:hypothetical protein
LDAFARIAEERILRAMQEGAFEGLEAAGRPLDLEDDAFVPEDLRVCYHILKNAGFTPPEVELRGEIMNLRDLINTLDEGDERLSKLRELNRKLLCYELSTGRRPRLGDYEDLFNQRFIQG